MFTLMSRLLFGSNPKKKIYTGYHKKSINEGTIPDPLLSLAVETPQYGFLNIKFLFDSGADVTILPLNPYGPLFNFDKKAVQPIEVHGISRMIHAYPTRLNFKIDGKIYPMRCYFAETKTIPILGRLDWWYYFSFTLDNKQGVITMIEN